MVKIVVTREVGEEALALLQASSHEIQNWPKSTPASREWILEHARGAAVICVTMADKVDRELLDAAGPALKTISTFSVGYDHVDVPLLKARGIRLGYTPEVLNDAVADTAVMLVLMAMRRAAESMAVVREGKWPQTPWSPFLLTGPGLSAPNLILGFLGFGRISHDVLKRLLAFTLPPSHSSGPRCIYTNSRARQDQDKIDEDFSQRFGLRVQRVGADELARQADVLVVLCSLTKETTHAVNSEFLAKMKKTAVLVNCARGPVVDSNALAAALKAGQIFGAGLDVVEGEPNVTSDHPLLKEPRCVVLPHIGSATIEARQAMADLCMRNAIAGANGEEMPSELL